MVGVESSYPRSFIKRARSFSDLWVGGCERDRGRKGREQSRAPYYSLCHGPCDEAVHDNAIVLVCA